MDFPIDDLDPATRGPVRDRVADLRLVALTPTFYIDLGSVITAAFRSNNVLEIQYRVGADSESMVFYGDQAAEAWDRFQSACRRCQS